MLDPSPRDILFKPNGNWRNRRHFTAWKWTRNNEIVYSVQGPIRSAIVLYHHAYKKFAIISKAGKQSMKAYEQTATRKEQYCYDDIFEAKAMAVNKVRSNTGEITVK